MNRQPTARPGEPASQSGTPADAGPGPDGSPPDGSDLAGWTPAELDSAGSDSAGSDSAGSDSAGLDADAAEVVRGEFRLLHPAVRADRNAVLALLHPDFAEVGTSGRVWDRRGVAEALAARSCPADPVTRVADLVCTRLAPGVIQLTYTAHEPDRTSLRSSVWLRDGDGPWLLRFHQGTLAVDRPRSAGPAGQDPPG